MDSIMDKPQKQFTAFLESLCTVSGHRDILPALKEGFKAYCEGINMADNYSGWNDTGDEMDTADEMRELDQENEILDAYDDGDEPTMGLVHPDAPARDKMFVNNNQEAYYYIWETSDELQSRRGRPRKGEVRTRTPLCDENVVDEISSSTGVPTEDVKRLINIFYASKHYIDNRESMNPNAYGPYNYVDLFA